MKKVISILVSLAILLSFSSISVLAADGSRKDMYSAFNKRTYNCQQYDFYEAQNITLQLLGIMEGEDAKNLVIEGWRANDLPKSDEQLLIYKFNLKYNKGPEKVLETHEVVSYFDNWYDASGKEVKIIDSPILPDAYPKSVELYPGATTIFYIPIIIKSTVGYPVFKSYNKTKEIWFNTNPLFLESDNAKIFVKSVSMNASAVTLTKNRAINLEAIISPSNATTKTVSWKSSKPSVAIVDGKGRVTGKSSGTTTITATTSDGKKVAKCTITVK